MEDVIDSLPRAAVLIIAWGLAARGLVSIYRVSHPIVERLVQIYKLPTRVNECEEQEQPLERDREDFEP